MEVYRVSYSIWLENTILSLMFSATMRSLRSVHTNIRKSVLVSVLFLWILA